jgi:hypothetical protein
MIQCSLVCDSDLEFANGVVLDDGSQGCYGE